MTRPLRAAIYARYSTDLQNAASIDDQIRVCERLAAEKGWIVTARYSDAAQSGASSLRSGFQALSAAAMSGEIDVVLAEGIDRLSRDQEHIAGFFKRMQYQGVRIVTQSEGEVSELHIGLGGTVSALYPKQLREKTRRGLEGRVRAGKAAGGLSYGYRLDRRPLPDGSFTTGDRVIDEAEARVVRQIFKDYATGESSRAIAIRLNKQGVPSPRGGSWSFSTISGNWKRGTGILNNELYIGKMVWNRQSFRKDPVTQKRQARPNPPEDWIIEEVPALRIINDALWDRVKARQGTVREEIFEARAETATGTGLETGRRPRHILSGLLACVCCGANYMMMSDSRYGCSAARNRGTCTNRKTIRREEVETRMLDGLRERLMAPDLVAAFVAEYQREMDRAMKEERVERDQQSRQLDQITREIDNIVAAIGQGMFHESMKARMDTLSSTATHVSN
jgi:DNA invertase Pin-like site-specific DNA recombinase